MPASGSTRATQLSEVGKGGEEKTKETESKPTLEGIEDGTPAKS